MAINHRMGIIREAKTIRTDLLANPISQIKIIKPPDPIPDPLVGLSIFLAGSIEMGEAEDWQFRLEKALKDLPITILDPRRDDWDSSWVQEIGNPQFREQVEWELDGLERASCVAFYFDPNTQSPITLLEVGLTVKESGRMGGQQVIVCCPEGYWRKGNVDVVCNKYGIAQVDTYKELEEELKELVGSAADSTKVEKKSYWTGIDRMTESDDGQELVDMFLMDPTVVDEPYPMDRPTYYPAKPRAKERSRDSFFKLRKETNPRVEIGKTASIGIRAMASLVRLILADYFDVDESKIYTLYHSTPAKNLDSIMSRGLVPGLPHGGADPSKPWLKDIVWMADDPTVARHHGLKQMEKKGVPGELVIFEIRFDPKQLTLYKALAKGFYTTDEIIPPGWIKVYEKAKAK